MVSDGAFVVEAVDQPRSGGAGIGQGLERGEGLRRDDEEGAVRVDHIEHRSHIRRVDVRDEMDVDVVMNVRTQCPVRHGGTEVRATDADVDDMTDPLSGRSLPRARPHPLGEARHAIEHVGDVGGHRSAVNREVIVVAGPQSGVEHGSVFGGIDVFSGEHRFG